MRHSNYTGALVLILLAAIFLGSGSKTISKKAHSLEQTIKAQIHPSTHKSPGPGKVLPGRYQPPAANANADCQTQSSEQLPDPGCTPGSTSSLVTESNLSRTICATKQPSPTAISPSLSAEVAKEYKVSFSKDTIINRLIPLSLGGDDEIANLWPETNSDVNGVQTKALAEKALTAAVCAKKISLAAAQQKIAKNWESSLNGL
jgi:hypothetical protein